MKEPLAAELGLTDLARDAATRADWIAILSANPRLIERPVVLADDGRAVIARPPEKVAELL
jgi:arsenate reductase